MKPARIIVLVIAVVAGGIAALLAGRSDPPPPPPVAQMETAEVLVASSDVDLGSTVTAQDMRWQLWPAAGIGSNFIRKNDRPDAIEQLAGSIARAPFSSGEPIRESKLIKGTGGGYMAAVLPAGMRAISVEVSPETGAGGFILPGDHVDVILSQRDRAAERRNGGIEVHTSEVILANVRVLAIDQTVEEKSGQRVVIGKTATVELSPRQAETLALSRQLGTLSLALRSIVDFSNNQPEVAAEDSGRQGGVNVVRFGVSTTANPK
jgi:pilus assembly protein CpaB